MTVADTPSQGTGIEAAAAAFDAILTGSNADTQEPKDKPEAHNDAEVDETEAQQADDESATPDDEHEADEAEGEESEDSEEATAEQDETDETPDPKQTKVTVKIDGKTEELPLDEVVRGYQRQADYTRKTSALAEERKSFEGERTAIKAEREQYAALLTALESQLGQLMPEEPDWNRLWEQDPLEYTRQKHVWDERNAKMQAARVERERLTQVQAQENEKRLATVRKAEWEKLIEARPEWKDPARWNSAKQEIVEYGRKAGFSDQDLTHAGHDHRLIKLLHDAAAYNKLMSSKPRPEPKRDGAPAPVKPSSKHTTVRPVSEVTRAKQRLAKTGRVEDAASLFDKLL
jgi:hypothetical protein